MKGPFPLSKYKVYIDHPDEAPEDVEVQEGSQGGLFYVKDPSSGEEEEEPSEPSDIEDWDYDGYQVESESPTDVEPGDKVYFEHPDGDYIVTIDSIGEDGTLHWEGYQWNPEGGFTSEFGAVVEDPDIAGELVEEPDMTNIEVGDVVAWEDDAGMVHYQQVEDKEGASTLVLGNGEEMSVWDVEYGVEGEETEVSPGNYDVPEGDEFTEEQIAFNKDLVNALEEGDASAIPAYSYMSNAGSIVDEDLAIDAYESILANEGNKTQRERMEKRLRGMGVDPEEVRESGIDPGSIPDVRQGTVYSGIDSETAVSIAAAGAYAEHTDNWETWNDFYGHLTQDELKSALSNAATNQYMLSSYDEPLDYEDGGPSPTDDTPSGSKAYAAITSRLEEDVVETVSEAVEAAPPDARNELKTAGAILSKNVEDRRQLWEEYGNDLPPSARKVGKLMFDESMSPKHRADQMVSNHSASTSHLAVYMHRSAMWGHKDGGDNENLNGYNDSLPIGPIEPSPELEQAISYNQNRIASTLMSGGIDEETGGSLPGDMVDNINGDGTITVYRGVAKQVTGFSSVESWSTNYDTASSHFDGNGVMKVDADPEDIFGMHGVNHNKHSGEREVTLLGHDLAEKVEVDKGTPIDFNELSKAEMEFVIASSPDEVEAALFDDIFDTGMYTEHRFIDGEKVPVEVAQESEQAESKSKAADASQEISKSEGSAIAQLADEMAQKASQTLKDGMTSGTSGVGQATYGGADEEEDEEEDNVEKERPDEHTSGPFFNGTSLRLEDEEVYCPEEGEVFEVGAASQGSCPECGADIHEDIEKEDDRVYIENVRKAPHDVIVHADENRRLYYKEDQSFETSDNGLIKEPEYEDLEDIAAIDEKQFPTSHLIRNAWSDPEYSVLALKNDDGVVGFTITKGNRLSAIAVDPDCTGEGFGKALLSKVMSDLSGKHDSMALQVRADNDRAKSLYESYGFSEENISKGHYENGDDAIEMKRDLVRFDEADEQMMKFYKDVVWYEGDLEKAPNMWEGSEHVPEFVKRFIERAVDAGAFFQGTMDSVSESVQNRLQRFFEEKMTQPQGWSLSSIVDDMEEEFGVSGDDASNIVRNETAALANKGREIAYEERPESDEYKFYWSNPMEHRTTPVCEYMVEKTHPKHGGTPVSMDRLKELLREAIDPAQNSKLNGEEFKGATPNRIEDWVPHHQCRSTFVRQSKLGSIDF